MIVGKDLLMHWWKTFNNDSYTQEELEKYESIIESYGENEVFNLVLDAFLDSDGSPDALLQAIRNNTVQELLNSTLNFEELTDREKTAYNDFKILIFNVLYDTYME